MSTHPFSVHNYTVYIYVYSYNWFRLFLAIVRWYICAITSLLLLPFLPTLVSVFIEHFYCSCFCFLYILNLLWSLVSYTSELLRFWIVSSWFYAVVLRTLYYWWLCSQYAHVKFCADLCHQAASHQLGCSTPIEYELVTRTRMSCEEWDVTPCSSVHVHRSFLYEPTSSTILKFEPCCLIFAGYLLGLTSTWKEYFAPKRRRTFTGLYDVTWKRSVFFMVTAVWTSDPVSYSLRTFDFDPLLWIQTGLIRRRGRGSRSCYYKLNVWAIYDLLYWSP
jgi:hypothetical protein